jgi:alkaline phosphatase D
MSKFSRRDFITSSALGFGALSLVGCSDNNDDDQAGINIQFLHGAASGDPLSDRLIIWTRISPDQSNATLNVEWQISTTQDFKTVLQKGTVSTSSAADFTVKVDVSNLKPATSYYYRFVCNGVTSPDSM